MTSSVRRLLGPALLVTVTLVGLLWPVAWAWLEQAGAEEVSDPVSISRYDARYTVQPEGLLLATEQIRAEFPSGRHGIFRYWDVADPADASVRYLPTVVSVTRDGRPEPYVEYWESGHRFLVAKIGDADTFLSPGTHTYVITYQVPGAVSPGTTSEAAPWVTTAGAQDAGAPGSAFLWSVVPSGWEMPIAEARVRVELPHESGAVQCATDPWVTTGPCSVQGAGTSTVTASASDLAPRTGMILRAAMQPDAPARSHLPWSVTWDPVLGRTVWVTVALVLLAVAAGLVGYLVSRSTHEDEPGFPVQYEPPPGLGPVQVVYLDSEEPGPNPLVASILYLAERGLVRLERPAEDTWRIVGIATEEQWRSVDSVTREVARRLGVVAPRRWGHGEEPSFHADGGEGAGQRLQMATDAIGPDVAEWSKDAGLMAGSAEEKRLKVLWFVVAAGAVALFALPALLAMIGSMALVPTLVGLVPAAFVVAAAGLTSQAVGQRHTAEGRLAWARAGGFRRLLSTPSSEERFDFSARTEAFLHFIPYAVAFGVADKWAEKYRTEMGTEPPIPVWYPMYAGHGMHGFYSGGDFDSFSKSVSASIGAYAAAQSASSSGGGGGGFGGGGGGGGGSW